MTTIKPVWTENQTISGFNDAAVGSGGGTTSGDLDLDNLGYDLVSVQIKIVFGSTPDNIALVRIWGSPDSGTTDDTIPLLEYGIEEATSATKIITFNIQDVPFININVNNQDSADTIDVSAIYAGRKWDNT